MPDYKGEKGFTLIEIIAVLILIAIVSAVVLSRGMSTAEADLKAKAEVLKNHIRFAQMKAMNADADKTYINNCESSYGISCSGSSYFMFRNCDKNLTSILPGANNVSVSLDNMTLTPNTDVTFDRWGRPCTDLTGNTLAAADITLTLSHPQVAQSETIRITKNTGYVP